MALIISHLLATSNLWMCLNSSFHANVSRIKENFNVEVGNNPIVTLFNYEFATWKLPSLESEDVRKEGKKT